MECCSSSDFEEDLENACAILVIKKSVNKRRSWIHNINLERQEKGDFQNLVQKIQEDPAKFQMY